MFMGVQTQPHVESRQTQKQAISPPNLTELGTTKPVGQEVTELGKPVGQEVTELGTTKPVAQEVTELGKPVGQEVTELGTTKPVGQEVTELETTKPVGQEATEQEVTKPFRQEVTEHEERDSELENNAAARDPEAQKILRMVAQQATWEKVPTFSDKNDEKRHLVIKSDRDDSKHIKAAADNLRDDMEKNDGPGNHQVETTAAEGGDEEEDNDNESVEMTAEEKEEMRNAVRDGDIDRLEDCLDRPGADIHMIYFKENLLMTAIRADQVHMAEFLLDNGVDHNFSTILLNMKDTRGASPSHTLECYKYSCRQMAYDKGLLEIVEIIDILNGHLFPGVTPRSRFPRYQRPPKSSSSGDDESDDDSDCELSSTSADQSNAARPGAKNRSRTGSKDGADAFPGEGAKDSEGQRVTMKRSSKTLELGTEVKGVPETCLGSETLHGNGSHHTNDMGTRENNDEGQKDLGKKKSVRRKENEKQRDGTKSEEELTSKHSAASKNLLEEIMKEADGKDVAGKPEDSKQFMEHSDEGYETMSPSPPLRQQHLSPKDQPSAIQTKATKGFMGLKRATENHLHNQLTAKYNEARPLRWRKVKSAGSYIVESPLWHQSLPSHLLPQTSSQVDILSSSPSSSSSASSSCSSSTPITEKRSANVTVEFESIQVLEDNSITVPKILRPSQKVFSSPESSASGSASPSSSTSRSSTSSAMTYPLKQRVANYMRMTASSFVKRRLESSFSQSYSSLDFVKSTSMAGNGNSRHLNASLSFARSSTDNSERKLDVTRHQAGHRGHLPQDVQVSPTNTCAASFKLGSRSDINTSLLEMTVPNIRNNRNVQVSRQTSSSSKSR